MVASSLVLAASSFLSLALGAPIVRKSTAGSYHIFGGDGTPSQGWPSESDWLSYDELWAINEPIMHRSCTQFPGQPEDNTSEEIAAIKEAISEVAEYTKLDARFLLSIMMQESKGCVRAPTTNYGQENPGLFQCFNGKATCNPDGKNFQTPCPAQTINDMVKEGAGINMPFGLMQAIDQAGTDDVSKYYKAARIYNSGSVHQSGNLGAGIATHCYATDVANRLVGWDSSTTFCNEEEIMSTEGSNTEFASDRPKTPEPAPQPEEPKEPEAAPEPEEPKTPEPAPESEPEEPNTPYPSAVPEPPAQPQDPENENGEAPEVPTDASEIPTNAHARMQESEGNINPAPGAHPNCKSWFTVGEGDSCIQAGVGIDVLAKLNAGFDESCRSMWLGYSYCIAA